MVVCARALVCVRVFVKKEHARTTRRIADRFENKVAQFVATTIDEEAFIWGSGGWDGGGVGAHAIAIAGTVESITWLADVHFPGRWITLRRKI